MSQTTSASAEMRSHNHFSFTQMRKPSHAFKKCTHTHTHTPAPSGLASGVAQPLGMSIKGTMTTFLDSLKASPPAIFAVLPRACGGRDGSPVTHNHSKKPFYVYFRILHAYTIIYLKYRVYC